MSRSRMPLYLGLAVAGGAGYYLYTAGGNPKYAEKQFEHDLKSVRDRATAHNGQVRAEAEKYGAQAGAKVDSAVAKAQDEYNRAAAAAREASANAANHVETYGKDVRKHVNQSVDAFDKKVEDAAAKTKSGVSSWFGGK